MMSLRRFDDSSSMSSVSSGTTTTTSSSMSSSTGGDMAELALVAQRAGKGANNDATGQPGSPSRRRGRADKPNCSNDHTNATSSNSAHSHTVVKCSPRKANVKKADCCMQTDTASALGQPGHNSSSHSGRSIDSNGPSSIYGWKKYLNEHGLKGDLRPSSAGPMSPAKVAIVSSVQSSDESHRRKTTGKGGSPASSSPVYSVNSGRAVAVIRANPAATTGRVTKAGPTSVRSSAHRMDITSSPSKVPPLPGRERGGGGYPSEIYSDTECMNSSIKSYPFCLTSQVLQSQSQAAGNGYTESRDRLSGIYGQVFTPWMLQRQAALAAANSNGSGSHYGQLTPRNAMTEAESMESLASLSALNGRASALKHELSQVGSPKAGVHPLMAGRKPRIHAASPSIRTGLRSAKDNDGDIFSSSLSLMSNASGVPNNEERHSQEVRKLRRELDQSNEKVVTLTSQLNTNAHMVAAFEQSLLAMTARLQQQTALSERKESELNMLKVLVDELNECRRRGGSGGGGGGEEANGSHRSGHGGHHHHRDSKSSKKDKHSKKGALVRRHTFAMASEELQSPASSPRRQANKPPDSVGNQPLPPEPGHGVQEPGLHGGKSSGWFRSSLSRAFRKNSSKTTSGHSPTTPVKLRSGSCSELQNGPESIEANSLPSSPAHSKSGHGLSSEDQVMDKCRQQLAEKDRQLTDLRLEALTSAHQLDSLNETLLDMRRQMAQFRLENERLRAVVTKSNGVLTNGHENGSASHGNCSKIQNGPPASGDASPKVLSPR